MQKSRQKQVSKSVLGISKPVKRRDYISWSALNLLERDEDAYIMRYLKGQEGYSNDAMAFGKLVAEALEDERSTNPFIRYLITFLPKFDVAEREITAKYKHMKLLGRPDSMQESMVMFREYKTGRTPWTQRKVDGHGQLVFYAAIIFLTTKRIPGAYLDWIPTEYQDGELKLTGEIKTFRRKDISMTEISTMLMRVEKAWERIEKLWQKETKQHGRARSSVSE